MVKFPSRQSSGFFITRNLGDAMNNYVKRLPYTEQLIIEIFGEYIFERDTTQPGYKLVNACTLGIPPHVRADFFRLVKPLGRANYVKMLRLDKSSLKKLDKFLAEQLTARLVEYIPEHDEVFTPLPGERAFGFLPCDTERAIIAVMAAKADGAISESQAEWLYNFHYPIRADASQLRLPE